VCGWGLSGVAAATAASYLVYFVLTVRISLWIELGRARRLRYLAMLALALVPTLGLALALERLWPGTDAAWTVALAKGAAVALAWGLTVLVGWHFAGWREAIRRRAPNTSSMPAENRTLFPPPED
jgi:hypothetical protein